jgi:DNA processing protein
VNERQASERPISYPPGFAATEPDRRALTVLLHLPSLTPIRLGLLAQSHPTATACLNAVRRGATGSRADRDRARSMDAGEAADRVRSCGAKLVAVGDAGYPPELLDLHDPPAGLFVRGRDVCELAPRVAIVGARNCSPTGREVAREIAGGLAQAGVCVVSGGARGIDVAAHMGALAGGGSTVAVLGCGIDTVYPRQHRRLLEQISREFALVSEYPPGTPAEPFRFPARNRIVAALGRAVVIVEGALGSGSMITAVHALDVGREVFAVPGAVTSALSAVPLRLIREGARMIRGAQDLMEDLGWQPAPPEKGPPDGRSPQLNGAGSPPGLFPDEHTVWRILGAALTLDQVAALTGMPLPAVLSALARLELRGLVRETGGRYERRFRPGASP